MIDTTIIEVDPRELKLLDNNARFMTRDEFNRLVANVRKDGRLTSLPLVYPHPDGTMEVLSGNHRTKAAIAADLEQIAVIRIDTALTADERLAVQLSHNSIAGHDDAHKLRELYDMIDDLDLREYSGLDDATLDLLTEVTVPPLATTSLDYRTLSILMLPEQLEAAGAALEEASSMLRANETWVGRLADWDRLLDTLDCAARINGGKNQAIALAAILNFFRDHTADFAEQATADPPPSKWVPIASIVGWDFPAEAARILNQAIERMVGREEITHPWQALEMLAADYLAGS